ncbi:MAG: hypothetical protein BZY87_00285 [SAR202 cluster bacterium Io17-Chloro-G6]|nr:MAG: hypothetical protein BZY87_00285 [SAR202 cluster bacterium Io17-Chloro-G6]
MNKLTEIESDIVAWLNGLLGLTEAVDDAVYLLVSDYFIPLCICFWMLGLWFQGRYALKRDQNQRAVLGAAIGLGFANLAVLIINQFVFRDRPIAGLELTNLLYAATDSSFPSNPAAVAFAAAMAIWLNNRWAALPVILLAGVWCLMRVVNGLFYPTDILAGAAIGASVSWFIVMGLRRIEPVTAWVLEGARFLRLA